MPTKVVSRELSLPLRSGLTIPDDAIVEVKCHFRIDPRIPGWIVEGWKACISANARLHKVSVTWGKDYVIFRGTALALATMPKPSDIVDWVRKAREAIEGAKKAVEGALNELGKKLGMVQETRKAIEETQPSPYVEKQLERYKAMEEQLKREIEDTKESKKRIEEAIEETKRAFERGEIDLPSYRVLRKLLRERHLEMI